MDGTHHIIEFVVCKEKWLHGYPEDEVLLFLDEAGLYGTINMTLRRYFRYIL